MNQFKNTKTKGRGCDSCVVVLDKSKDFTRFVYSVTFSAYTVSSQQFMAPLTYEGDAEVVLNADGSVNIDVDPGISRLNRYGNQPQCIAKQYPHLRSYCWCKGFKG